MNVRTESLDYTALDTPFNLSKRERSTTIKHLYRRPLVVTIILVLLAATAITLLLHPIYTTLSIVVSLVVVQRLVTSELQHEIDRRVISRKLRQFSADNGLNVIPAAINPSFKGVIFNIFQRRKLVHGIDFKENGMLAGNFRYMYDSGYRRYVKKYGFIKFTVNKYLPHIILDSWHNDGMTSSLPETYDTLQRFDLEGDFKDHFKVYAARKYEKDALYFLTPEVMAMLQDSLYPYDIEIIDNEVYLYSDGYISFNDSTALRNMYESALVLRHEIERPASRYTDERARSKRVELNVGKTGRRLTSARGVFGLLIGSYIVVVALPLSFVATILVHTGAIQENHGLVITSVWAWAIAGVSVLLKIVFGKE